MLLKKKLIFLLPYLILHFLFLSAQMKQFVAPKTADALVNPLKENTPATAEGKKTYITYCAPCHGEKGKGDGVASAGLSKPPADHTSSAVQKQTDGAIFWKISEGNTPMPGYKKGLSETQIWQLINYIRTLSKGAKK